MAEEQNGKSHDVGKTEKKLKRNSSFLLEFFSFSNVFKHVPPGIQISFQNFIVLKNFFSLIMKIFFAFYTNRFGSEFLKFFNQNFLPHYLSAKIQF